MRETEFYRQILGLEEPWFVANVKQDTESQQVDVFVEHPESTTRPLSAPNAESHVQCMTTRGRVVGDIWTQCNSGQSCMPNLLA
ncbi:hypothetical protein V7x_24110 [Crateriforma conspicua]|uniref:Uncharacterized protein n=1 Tax=Crateriforma conspicua TaxID=2527996 RepID=A0A5C6FZW8_9PLAN|nr:MULTISPECIES: hypothetical protein [Crateriforma]TWU66840.1 hypothetical protein V7x_24110 [Crateriforma conspicua]